MQDPEQSANVLLVSTAILSSVATTILARLNLAEPMLTVQLKTEELSVGVGKQE
jgi:hypothetical protein